MRSTFHAVLLFVATIALRPSPAIAQPAVTRDEYICGSNVAKTFARFILKKSTCVEACIANGRKTFGPFDDCFAPFGGATATCILDPTRGAEARARASIGRRCAADCPECYVPSVCVNGEPFVTNVETELDLLSRALVYCVEGNAQTVSPQALRCEDAVARAVVKLGASRIRCYTRCFGGVYGRSCATCKSGELPAGSCTPPATDARTAACLAHGEALATAAIDASCSAVGADPACYVNNGLASGAAWVSFMANAIDGQVPNVACGG